MNNASYRELENKSKGYIDDKGNLFIKRKKFKSQKCCRKDKPCGDWCPHFEDQYKLHDTDETKGFSIIKYDYNDNKETAQISCTISICEGNFIEFNKFEDRRYKNKVDVEKVL